MSKLHIILADPDKGYCRAVHEWFQKKHAEEYSIDLFTNINLLDNYIREITEPVDIFLVDSEIFFNLKDRDKFKCVILLNNDGSNYEEKHVNKYQPMDKFLSDILDIYSESDLAKKKKKNKNSKLIAFYSPQGGAGTTTFSSIFSFFISNKYRKKVFFLSMEAVSSQDYFFCSSVPKGLSDVFYYVKERNNNLHMKIEASCSRMPNLPLSFFRKPESCFEWSELNEEDIGLLIENLQGMGYEYVILDMPSFPISSFFKILDGADEFVIVVSDDFTADKKLEFFTESIRKIELKENKDLRLKMRIIFNKFSNKNSDIFKVINKYNLDIVCTVGNLNSLSNFNSSFYISDELNRHLNSLAEELKIC